ncbi:hypothetical protein P7K49_011034 [Saguinus oedipus]|uniref:Uncharacterized protein n=1 Tax=Saguinus oedipus TaxID=9490 RepID=A0ABQ9VPI2_SAGOE|nr:hypothetical protein P7K49_011034 [Saguinus oedipus]
MRPRPRPAIFSNCDAVTEATTHLPGSVSTSRATSRPYAFPFPGSVRKADRSNQPTHLTQAVSQEAPLGQLQSQYNWCSQRRLSDSTQEQYPRWVHQACLALLRPEVSSQPVGGGGPPLGHIWELCLELVPG